MAERLIDLTRQIDSARQLEGVVTAMRGIAASRMQRGRTLLTSVSAYRDVVSRAIGEALQLQSAPDSPHAEHGNSSPPAHILVCAEQGFAGAFSERVLTNAGDIRGAKTMVVGSRGAAAMAERGLAPSWTTPMASDVDGIVAVANRVADALYEYVLAGEFTRVELSFARFAHGRSEVERRSLLPIDFARFSPASETVAPLTTLPGDVLLARLAGEYVFAQLCEAITVSFAAENEARMLAMTSARTNVEARLAELTLRERQLRQQAITDEIIELAAAVSAEVQGRQHR